MLRSRHLEVQKTGRAAELLPGATVPHLLTHWLILSLSEAWLCLSTRGIPDFVGSQAGSLKPRSLPLVAMVSTQTSWSPA